ncbi:MAG: ABC transporter permease, partial [Nitrospinae bacterium RIFCSPLOWO2_12_FULL_45_22]
FLSAVLFTDVRVLLSALQAQDTIFAIKLTLITATLATLLALILAVPASYALSKVEFYGKSLVDTFLDIPIVISPIALGAALLIFFNTPLGRFIETYGIRFVFEVPGIVLAQFAIITALAIRLMKATFDSMGTRYEIVARTLGCNKWQAFFKVTLPLAKNGLLAASIMAWARAVGEFGATITLVGATKMKTETLPIAIYLNLATADIEKAMAIIIILIGLSLSTLIFLRKITGRGYPID